jgi:CxxC motif-containing protein (DUF1111 family)
MRNARHLMSPLSPLLGLLAVGMLDGSRARAEFGDPLPGLKPDEVARFQTGKETFEEEESPADGLGPVFNDVGCAVCHSGGATGGGSARIETRFGSTAGGSFDPLLSLGGSLIQERGIGAADTCNFVGEVVPPQATVRAGRRTTPLFGLGLVDAVPDARLRAIAALEKRLHPATAGRPATVSDVATGQLRVGRFGWKCQNPSLHQFAGDAYLNEMGITSPLFPTENCPQGDCSLLRCDPVADPEDDGTDVDQFTDFMRLLAPPPIAAALTPRGRRGSSGPSSGAGSRQDASRLFTRLGCADCHLPTLASGDSDVRALRFQRFQPYSDFLLHDMGPLADGIAQADATAREMRTAPLWGLRLQTTFLHDGRAATIAEAILAHDGQARAARDAFAGLDAPRQAALLAFLAGL